MTDTRTPKQRVWDHYGACCATCGESDPLKLCLDHVENDGAQERRRGLTGARLYQHILRTGAWRRYQLLCWNCNRSKQLVHQRQPGPRGASMKPGLEKRQFSQRILLSTYEYIARLAANHQCSMAQALDLMSQEHAALSTPMQTDDQKATDERFGYLDPARYEPPERLPVPAPTQAPARRWRWWRTP